MIDLRHPLAVLANRMPWQEIEASLAQRWARQVKAGKKIEDLDLFGPVSAVAGGGVSDAGRPRLPTRLMVALLYLKLAFNESDEEVIQRWGETPTWQYFSGNEYFEHQWPCDPTQLGRFRKALGEEGVEELLARTMEVAPSVTIVVRSLEETNSIHRGRGKDRAHASLWPAIQRTDRQKDDATHNQSDAQISRDTGVAVSTLYSWINAFAHKDSSCQQSLHAQMTGTPKPSWPPSFRRLP